MVIMYFLPDSEEGKEPEIPSRREVGPMDQKPGWAYLTEETEEIIHSLRGFPSSTFASCIAVCLLLWPVFVIVITGEVYWRSYIFWKSNFNVLKYFISSLMYCLRKFKILFKTLIISLRFLITWKWFKIDGMRTNTRI